VENPVSGSRPRWTSLAAVNDLLKTLAVGHDEVGRHVRRYRRGRDLRVQLLPQPEAVPVIRYFARAASARGTRSTGSVHAFGLWPPGQRLSRGGVGQRPRRVAAVRQHEHRRREDIKRSSPGWSI
jgi:hypothetical protein